MESDVAVYLVIALGVLVAVLYPVLKGFVQKAFPPLAAGGLPPWAKKYLVLLAFSLASALIVMAIYRNANPDASITFWAAFLLGFGWEASIEKLITTKP